jgi:hypothetical protein
MVPVLWATVKMADDRTVMKCAWQSKTAYTMSQKAKRKRKKRAWPP